MGTHVSGVKETKVWMTHLGSLPVCRPSNGSSAVSLATRGQWLVLGRLSMISPLNLGVLSLGGHLRFLVLHTYSVSPHCSLLVPILRPLFFSRREWRQVSEFLRKTELKLKHGALCSCGTLYDLTWGQVLSSSTGEEVDSDDSTNFLVSAFFNFLCYTCGKVMIDDQVPWHCLGALHWPSTKGFLGFRKLSLDEPPSQCVNSIYLLTYH